MPALGGLRHHHHGAHSGDANAPSASTESAATAVTHPAGQRWLGTKQGAVEAGAGLGRASRDGQRAVPQRPFTETSAVCRINAGRCQPGRGSTTLKVPRRCRFEAHPTARSVPAAASQSPAIARLLRTGATGLEPASVPEPFPSLHHSSPSNVVGHRSATVRSIASLLAAISCLTWSASSEVMAVGSS